MIRYTIPPFGMWPAWQTALIPSIKDSFYCEGKQEQGHRSPKKEHQRLHNYSHHWMHSISEHMLRLHPRAYTWSSIGPGNGRQCWPPGAPLFPTARGVKTIICWFLPSKVVLHHVYFSFYSQDIILPHRNRYPGCIWYSTELPVQIHSAVRAA